MKKTMVIALTCAVLAASTASVAYSECSQDKKCCSTTAAAASKDPTAQEVVLDPVCGMDVKAADSKYKSIYKGKTYYFCSSSCKKSFDKNPSKYIGATTNK